MSVTWEGLELVGSLHAPATSPPHPAVLLLQGSGPSGRDADGYFIPIREAFLEAGVAVCSFDKPGCGESDGDWRNHALEDRAAQATAVMSALACHAMVDEKRIGVWGQSQGGWLVQILAARAPHPAFAIANSAPSLSVVEQDLYGCRHTMMEEGFSDEEIEAALAFIRSAHEAAARDDSYDDVVRSLVASAKGRSWYGYATVDDAQDWQLTKEFVQEGYEPHQALVNVSCPFLAIYGGRDVLLPAWRSAQETGEALQEAPTTDAMVVIFPDANHRIRASAHGPFAEGYLDLLTSWTHRRTAMSSPD